MKYFIVILISLLTVNNLVAQETIFLYNGNIPGNREVPDKETSTVNGILRISHISKPSVSIFLPPKEKASGTAIIICPGGGYGINAMAHEGVEVAKKLNEIGIAAFVLKYRLPDDAVMVNKTIAPLQDAQEAIKLVREGAANWNIDPKKIGILGFSAGGHLASTAGTHFKTSLVENKRQTSVRPDFMVLIYPVISFETGITHMGSRENLLGKQAEESLVKLYSNELQVTGETPPTFLVHAADDRAVNPANSLRFFEALLSQNIPAELHIYQAGGHGFGLNNQTTKDSWMDRCAHWLLANGWIPQ